MNQLFIDCNNSAIYGEFLHKLTTCSYTHERAEYLNCDQNKCIVNCLWCMISSALFPVKPVLMSRNCNCTAGRMYTYFRILHQELPSIKGGTGSEWTGMLFSLLWCQGSRLNLKYNKHKIIISISMRSKTDTLFTMQLYWYISSRISRRKW